MSHQPEKTGAKTSGPETPEGLWGRGHLACAGCGAPLIIRNAMEVLGPKTMVVIPASCFSIVCGTFPNSALKVPVYNTPFATGAVAAAGVKAALDVQGKGDTTVMVMAGDGGTFDIGLQSLSGAAERNDDIIYICYDNEAYMNTGIQRSSATPFGAWTTTTPESKARSKKNMIEIMAAHEIPYAATASIAFPDDFAAKLKKARERKGMRFFHVLAPCPTGWRIPSSWSVKVSRLAVHTNVFPLYEVEDGYRYRITVKSRSLPVGEYLMLQGRFKHLSDEQLAEAQSRVDRGWVRLNMRERESIETDMETALV